MSGKSFLDSLLGMPYEDAIPLMVKHEVQQSVWTFDETLKAEIRKLVREELSLALREAGVEWPSLDKAAADLNAALDEACDDRPKR